MPAVLHADEADDGPQEEGDVDVDVRAARRRTRRQHSRAVDRRAQRRDFSRAALALGPRASIHLLAV